MKPIKRIWKLIASAGISLLLAFLALTFWNKRDFCEGWADHYTSRAMQLRSEAENLDLSQAEKREYLIAAASNDVISSKYSKVARKPWKPYPRYPLISREEQYMVARQVLATNPE